MLRELWQCTYEVINIQQFQTSNGGFQLRGLWAPEWLVGMLLRSHILLLEWPCKRRSTLRRHETRSSCYAVTSSTPLRTTEGLWNMVAFMKTQSKKLKKLAALRLINTASLPTVFFFFPNRSIFIVKTNFSFHDIRLNFQEESSINDTFLQ